MKNSKERLDISLTLMGLAPSRTRAQAMIKAGLVQVNGKVITRTGYDVSMTDKVAARGPEHPWVSRGGMKLAHGLSFFSLNPANCIALDIGASTGGFTDVLLRYNAARVYAVDVGVDQLDIRLRSDPRVVVLDKTNARFLDHAHIPEEPECIVCDASFISLKTVLPAALSLAAPHAWLLALIKPQFEVGKGRVGKGGVVRDSHLHEEVCADIQAWLANNTSWNCVGLTDSPILGPDGNREFLIYARNDAPTQ